MRRPKFTTRIFRTKRLALLVVLILALAVGGYYYHSKHSTTPAKKTTSQKPYVNLSPATAAEKQPAQNNKLAPHPSTSSTNQTSSTSGQQVTPVITNDSPSNVRAYIPSIVEDGGTCTATYTQGSVSRTGSSTSVANVSDTVCPAISISGVSGGVWTLTYTYSSSTSKGSVTKQVSL